MPRLLGTGIKPLMRCLRGANYGRFSLTTKHAELCRRHCSRIVAAAIVVVGDGGKPEIIVSTYFRFCSSSGAVVV